MGLSKRVRFEVFKRDRFTCQYCGRRPPDTVLEIDHIVPKGEGGPDDIENLTTACLACNRGKAGIPLEDVAPALNESDVLASIQEMLERRLTLTRSVQVARAEREAEDEAVEMLRAQWIQSFGHDGGFEPAGLRTFFDRLELREIQRAVDAAAKWRSEYTWADGTRTWRYFCGVCWTMIRQKEGVEE